MADASRHYFQFRLPDGKIKFKTFAGGLITIVFSMLVLAYAITQFVIVWDRTSYTVLEKSTENTLTHDKYTFGKE